MARTGIDCVIGCLEGGIEAWKAEGLKLTSTKVMKVESEEQIRKLLDGNRVVDVRNLTEWMQGIYPEATT